MDGGRNQRRSRRRASGILWILAGLLSCAGCQSTLLGTQTNQSLTTLNERGQAQEASPLAVENGSSLPTQPTAATLGNYPGYSGGKPKATVPPPAAKVPPANSGVKQAQYAGPLTDNPDAFGPRKVPTNPSGPENLAIYPRRSHLCTPGECRMMSLPTYTIEPPDVLLIDALRLVPKAPYRIEPLDQLDVRVAGTLPDQPIAGNYAVEPGGSVNLGPTYGRVMVLGLTLEEATHAVDQHVRRLLKEPEVSITLIASAGQQQISGEHLVGPDGMVNLGTYGSVYVTGLTLAQARAVIENHLSKFLEKPIVSVDVYAYNSKVYYVISAGAGAGDSVTRYPITGRETVLDALSQVNGLTRASNKKIWIARPNPGMECDTILPVNWRDIVKGGSIATNYQLLPGDRLYLDEDHWLAADSLISKVTAPVERVFGFILLGSQTVQNLQTYPGGPNNTNR